MNAVLEVVSHRVGRKPATTSSSDGGVDSGTAEESFDFRFYPYLDVRRSLHTLVQTKGRLPEATVLPLFRQICDIVRVSHAGGVALRDLKLRRLVWRPNSSG